MNLKFIASSAGFAGLGAVVAWAFTADRADQKMKDLREDHEQLLEAFRENLRDFVQLKYKVDDQAAELEALHTHIDNEAGFGEDFEYSPGESDVEINSGGEIVEVKDESLEEHQEPTDEEIEEERAHLQRLIEGFIPSKDIQKAFVEERPVVASTRYDPPFVISEQEFSYPVEEGDEYAKITLKYYPQGQVLLDEDEDVIDDVEGYIGWRSLNRFGDESNNPDVVYVRNRRMEVDFEVERVDEDIPLHVKYAMPRAEFVSRERAGKLRLSEDDG